MIHLVMGGAIMLGASFISWHYNQKTQEEKYRQERAYAQRSRYYDDFRHAKQNYGEHFAREQKKQAEKQRKLLLDEIDNNFKKIEEISLTYKQLFEILQKEILDDCTSPYRKSALKREYAQMQDGQLRLDEYEKYLEHQRDEVNELWQREYYSRLLDMLPAETLLPDEWLYVGKLVIMEGLEDIGKKQPKFGHRLNFNGFGAEIEKQQALALSYGDEFPMMITKTGKYEGVFFGCVARGIAFHDYIRLAKPMPVLVERYVSKSRSNLCAAFDGLIQLELPDINRINPSLRCISGQTLHVYFDSYDASLSGDPQEKRNAKGFLPRIKISEKRFTSLGTDIFEIYLTIDKQTLEKIPDNSDFYHDETHWMLDKYDFSSQQLSLLKGTVKLHCQITPIKDGLEVISIEVFDEKQIGLDLPFSFVVIPANKNYEQYLGWQYGVEQLFNFSSQVMLDLQGSEKKLKQIEFFRRWQKVTEYQKEQESSRAVDFDHLYENIDNKILIIINAHDINQAAVNDRTVISLLREITESGGSLRPQFCCNLTIWDQHSCNFIPAVEHSRLNQVEYQIKDNTIEIVAPFNRKLNNIDFEQRQKFRFTVTLPNSPIQRQLQALTALFENRMVEPRLKDIFLSPEEYRVETIAHWQAEPIWKDNLKPSQKNAVHKALKAKHIAMIQGPPGTGKTTSIVEMLYQLLANNLNQKILIVSQQNTAVDNAIKKFKERYPELIKDNVNIIRIGNPKKIDDEIKEDHFDDIYQGFINDRLMLATKQDATFTGEMRNANYMWRALLSEMKAKETNQVSDEFFATMLMDKNMIGATCVGLAARKGGIDHLMFDIAIIDEAGRATVPELLIPLLRAKKAVLIGDHYQLPPSIAPVLREDLAKEQMEFLQDTFLETSFFEILFEQLPEQCTATLEEQFRMVPDIGNLVAKLFYTRDGKRYLSNGKGDNFTPKDPVSDQFLQWHNVKGKQQSPKGSTSSENALEAEAICNYLSDVAEKYHKDIDVAVITPYGAQKRLIRRKLTALSKIKQEQNIKLGSLTIKVDTVDSFQGSEAELVCYSTVRTSGSLQFILDKKRLNVACSRAKENLVFFGDKEFLTTRRNKDSLFKEIAECSIVKEYQGNPINNAQRLTPKPNNRKIEPEEIWQAAKSKKAPLKDLATKSALLKEESQPNLLNSMPKFNRPKRHS